MPSDSLAARRARPGELTAADDRLSIGTQLRVTNLSNGKNVTVRVTDRDVSRRKGTLDLCKEAADRLDMIHAGTARVRMEILSDDDGGATTSAPAP